MLLVCEIFGPTIQGEGLRCGIVSTFIRLARCNMSCAGYGVEYIDKLGNKKIGCDSYYAVDTSYSSDWVECSSVDIINTIKTLTNNKNTDIVITGGEPLLYWNNSDFQALLEYYYDQNIQVTIETNGSIDIILNKEYQKNIIFSISLKLSDTKESAKKRINFDTIKKMLFLEKSYLKFVISKDNIVSQEEEILQIQKNINIDSEKIFLMPMGSSENTIIENASETISLAIKHSYRYTDRLHIRVWNNKRGV